jgi:hypothetical protein
MPQPLGSNTETAQWRASRMARGPLKPGAMDGAGMSLNVAATDGARWHRLFPLLNSVSSRAW